MSTNGAEPRYTALARRFGDALRVGDPGQADRVVDDALAAGAAPDAVQSLVVGPAMARIGELWEAGIISVAEEHLATAICQRVLVRLYAVLSAARSGGPRRERVLLAAIEGQRHVLGLQMVADVLDGAGFDVLYLGADVPIPDLRAFVADRRPSVVGLTFGVAPQARRLAEAVLAIHDASPAARLMLGGPGIPSGLRSAGYPWVGSSMDAVRTVEELIAGPPQTVPEIVEVLASGLGSDPESQESVVAADAIAGQLARVADDATDVVRRHLRRLAEDGGASSRGASTADPLTGLPGRAGFLARLRQTIGAPGTSGAVLVVAVDDLGALNDRHGRAVGDAVLRTVADLVRDALGPGDLVARTADNEFMAVLPGATRDGAERVAEWLQTAVAAGTTPRVTVSVGTAPLSRDPREVLLSAATALHAAKLQRRDRRSAADRSSRSGPGAPGPDGPRSGARSRAPEHLDGDPGGPRA